MGLTDQRKRAKDTADYQQNEKKITDYRQKKINRLPTWADITDICFQKVKISREFCIFSSLRSSHIKVSHRISCHLLTFWPEEQSAGSFYRTISGTQAHETSHCNSGIRKAQPHNYTKQQQLPIKPKKFGLMTVRVPVQGATFNMRGQPGVQSQPWQGVKISREFCIFSSLRSNHIKVSYRISCHLLTFWPEEQSAGSFYRTISGTQAHETSHCNGGIGIGTYVVNPGSSPSRGKAFYP